MARQLAPLCALLLLAACEPSARHVAAPAVATGATPAPTGSANHWHEDAAEAAFTEGKRTRKLVLVDLWAPWCHTCLSMRAEVLRPDVVPELASVVLLSIDTERAGNEAFLARYPVGVWPTFYLVDPQTGDVRGRWLGAATPAQLSQWLKAGESERPGYEQLLREADAFATKRELAQAEASYRAALAAAPTDWAQRPAALVSLISVLSKQRKDSSCLELALQTLPAMPASVSAVDFAATALGCADRSQADENAAKLRAVAEQTLARDCDTAAPGAAVDDQADACGNLRRVREALKDSAGARSAAERALLVIATGSAGAPPKVQAIYDWERTSSLVFLGRRAEAEALLLEREKQLPESYNPPHYLARLYRDSQRWDDGLAAIRRAIAKAYGPRRIGFLGIEAELLKGAGKLAEARLLLERQLAEYRALPPGQRQPAAEAEVKKRLGAWSEPAP
jgi:thioredoxin-like negative regulator of GroEL